MSDHEHDYGGIEYRGEARGFVRFCTVKDCTAFVRLRSDNEERDA